jgi:hypothetical protein
MSYRSRMLWVEVLLWSALVLIVFTFIARIFFWQHVREAEASFISWLGISPGVHDVLKFVAAILVVVYFFSRYGPFRRKT